jgi:hypothetical protein
MSDEDRLAEARRTLGLDDGLMDAKGRWVPRRLIKEVDLVRHELVLALVAQAQEVSATLARFKGLAAREIDAFVSLSAEQYDTQVGGKKGNITLTSYDGRYKIIRAMADRLVFDERLQAAKSLVDECIREWTNNSRDEIRALVEHAFQVDRQGKISTERVLGLRRLEIDSSRWKLAMKAIGDSIQVASTTAYLRFYERVEDTDEYRAIPLDLAAIRGDEEA